MIACSTASRIFARRALRAELGAALEGGVDDDGEGRVGHSGSLRVLQKRFISQRSPRAPRRISLFRTREFLFRPWRSWRESFRSTEIPDAFGGVRALSHGGHQRDTYAAAARIAVRRIARDVAAR